MPAYGRLLTMILLTAMLLAVGAWRDVTGNTINPRYVERIKDGQTSKNEILVMFGEPQEIKRTAETIIYIYRSFKDTPALPYDPDKREPKTQSTTPYFVDEEKRVRKIQEKTEGKIPRSTLVIYFKPDGQTVSGHEYTEH
jgi:outer membrane protein assembly factor BamE (lipoprotein component of BamABCDE complex)